MKAKVEKLAVPSIFPNKAPGPKRKWYNSARLAARARALKLLDPGS